MGCNDAKWDVGKGDRQGWWNGESQLFAATAKDRVGIFNVGTTLLTRTELRQGLMIDAMGREKREDD